MDIKYPVNGKGKIFRPIKELQDIVRSFRPVSSPGILTNRTTRGTNRIPINRSGRGGGGSTVPRWG